MKKRSHIQIAIDALKKQHSKYQSEFEKAGVEEQKAAEAREYFAEEMNKLEDQIASLEGTVKEMA